MTDATASSTAWASRSRLFWRPCGRKSGWVRRPCHSGERKRDALGTVPLGMPAAMDCVSGIYTAPISHACIVTHSGGFGKREGRKNFRQDLQDLQDGKAGHRGGIVAPGLVPGVRHSRRPASREARDRTLHRCTPAEPLPAWDRRAPARPLPLVPFYAFCDSISRPFCRRGKRNKDSHAKKARMLFGAALGLCAFARGILRSRIWEETCSVQFRAARDRTLHGRAPLQGIPARGSPSGRAWH